MSLYSLLQRVKSLADRLLLFVLLAMHLFGICAQAQSLESYALDPRIWTGEITIERVGSADIKEDNSLTNAHVVKTYRESRKTNDHWHIKACGEAGQLYILEGNAQLSESREIKSTYKERSRDCDVKKPDLQKPGNSGHRTVISRISRYEGTDCPPLEETLTVTLMVWPGGRYVLNVMGGTYATLQQDELDYTKWVCDGRSDRAEFHYITVGINEKARSTMRHEGEGVNVHNIITTFKPPVLAPAGFSFEGKVRKDGSIADALPISEIKAKKKGGYHEKKTATWSFTASNPCEIVYQRLIKDLALAQAFADTKRRDFYDHYKDYRKACDQWAQKIYSAEVGTSGNDSTGGGESETDMSTNCDCIIQGDKAFEEKVRKQCLPHLIYKSVLKHEKMHVLQCKMQKSLVFCSGSPHVIGPNEVEAYIAGAKVYHYWLKENCPNYDVEAIKKRIKALQAK